MKNVVQHVTMFKAHKNERGYLKCVISEVEKPDFEAMGFVGHIDLIGKTSNTEMPIIGSPFDGMSDKKDIEEKLLELTGGDINIDRRGSVQTVADKAAKAYAQWLAGNED